MAETKDTVLEGLVAVVGKDNVTTSPEVIASYAQDQSFTPASRPHYAVFPESTAQVQEIVKLANECGVPVVPRSSPVSLHGASIPGEGGILVDLGRMNRILEVNERNWYAIIEPGVSFLKLNEELKKHGFRVAASLLTPPSASVVSTYLERTPVVTAADFTYGSEHVISYTVVVPSGDTFTVGHPPLANTPASSSDGPGLNFYRIFQGAQGTLGIVTWMVIRVLPLPKARKVFFFPCDDIERAVEVISRIQKSELGLECFALNSFNLAALLVKEAPGQARLLKSGEYIGPCGAQSYWTERQLEQFVDLRDTLPPWTVVLCLSAVGPIPREKIAYQELDLKEAMTEIGVEPKPTVSGLLALDKVILDETILPWRLQKRFGYQGSCQELMFCSSPDRVGDFDAVIYQVADQFGYPAEDIGGYLLPMERGRACYLTYDLHCDLDDPEQSLEVSDLFDSVSELLITMGAFFDRPYGKWARMVYSRAGSYTEYARKVKGELDPNNIMNPGKLCF
ncbi:MAG: FAD-binding oxidoreductase [Chloroflexota bacterium]